MYLIGAADEYTTEWVQWTFAWHASAVYAIRFFAISLVVDMSEQTERACLMMEESKSTQQANICEK